jgi:hypothetical protein
MSKPEITPVIWLAPECEVGYCCPERLWCEDPQECCEECGRQWIKYVMAPEAEQLSREVFEDEPIE